jgi:predicted nucleic acid-binding protein
MSVPAFVDTNVLLYADDRSDTEDLQPGFRLDSLEIVNPFLR